MPGKIRHGHAVHGKRTKTYFVWSNMIQRCLNNKHPCWPSYGGRGIWVCREWLSFDNFLRDMGSAPPGLTLDRLDNDLGYYRENCRWVTHKVNCSHTRKTRLRELFGEKKTLGEWCELFCINPKIVESRTRRGEDLYSALCRAPVRKSRADLGKIAK